MGFNTKPTAGGLEPPWQHRYEDSFELLSGSPWSRSKSVTSSPMGQFEELFLAMKLLYMHIIMQIYINICIYIYVKYSLKRTRKKRFEESLIQG